MRYLVLLLSVLILAGCGGGEPEKKSAAKPKTTKKKSQPVAEKQPTPPPPPPPKIPDDAFTDIPAALEAVVKASEIADQVAMSRADQWMVQRGTAGIEPLGAVLNDEAAPLAKRIAASRALGQMGPGAKPILLAGIKSSTERVRIVSIEALGRIKPPDREILDTCMKLAKEEADADVQRYAITAIGKMGPAAKDAAPLLMEIQNSKQHNETVRAAAHDALRLVDKRKGLMGLNEEKK